MHGPFPLWPSQIDMHVTVGVGGVYLLGKDPRKVALVARVDKDMRKTIKTHGDKYRFFWFDASMGRAEAFATHCRLYHKHEADGLDDPTHPAAPAGTDLKCPVCGK